MTLPTANAADIDQLSRLLRLMQSVLFLKNDLDECIALSWHSERVGADVHGQPIYGRTQLGDLVHAAKPYNREFQTGDLRRATQLAAHLIAFINAHPTYRRADAVIPVPPSNLNKPFDLPRKMAQEVAQATGKLYLPAALRKDKDTKPMKEVPPEQKKQNILDAFSADTALVQGRSIILIDDLYGSGATISEAGRTLKAVGAALVLGLTATKNLGNK
jgi:predicted amidophosphoribosyltransferase